MNFNDYFSTPLCSGKTFIYLATREGKLDLVRYFIEEKLLDFKVKSNINDKDENEKQESNLEVASRWNHVKIVRYYLSLPCVSVIRDLTNNKEDTIFKNNFFLHNYSMDFSSKVKAKTNLITYSKEDITKAISCSTNTEIVRMLKMYFKCNYSRGINCFGICG